MHTDLTQLTSCEPPQNSGSDFRVWGHPSDQIYLVMVNLAGVNARIFMLPAVPAPLLLVVVVVVQDEGPSNVLATSMA